ASGQCEVAPLALVAQLSARTELLAKPFTVLPRLAGLNVGPIREGDEVPPILRVPDQGRGLKPRRVATAPFEPGAPAIDKLLLVTGFDRPVAGGPGGCRLTHLTHSFLGPSPDPSR